MVSRNGQAALEFLMTYGWAILAVIIGVGSLVYLGVLNPMNLLPQKCTMESGFACKDMSVGSYGVQIRLANSMGKEIQIDEVVFRSKDFSGNCSTGRIARLLANGMEVSIYADDPATCAFIGSGRSNLDIDIKYRIPNSNIVHVAKGNMLASAQPGKIVPEPGALGGSAPNLVAYWKFDDGSGTSAKDSSGYQNTGNLFNGSNVCSDPPTPNCASWTSGISGTGLRFWGVNSSVIVPFSQSLNLSSQITMAARIQVAAAQAGNRRIISKWTSSGGSYLLGYANMIPEANIVNSNGALVNAIDNVPMSFGNWYYLVGTYDGARLKIYVNGVLKAQTVSANPGISTISAPVVLGALQWNILPQYDFVNGILDEVRIYDRALSDIEVAALSSS